MSLETRFYGMFRQECEAAKTALLEGLGAGTPRDFAEYREKVGYIHALDDMLARAREIDRKITGNQEDEGEN